MSDLVRVPETSVMSMSPTAMEVIEHLCEGDCRTYGSVLQWCETRGDCVYAVVCPGCTTQFLLDEEDVAALERWTTTHGDALVCGLKDDPAA